MGWRRNFKQTRKRVEEIKEILVEQSLLVPYLKSQIRDLEAEKKALLDRLMARDFGEFKTAELYAPDGLPEGDNTIDLTDESMAGEVVLGTQE